MADEGGFTAAATKLGMTQSGVSQAMHALEDSLGVALLSRGRDRISPTQLGAQALTEARAALQAVERLREHCAGWAGLDKGTLRIGSIMSCATRLLPDRLRAFKTRYPRIEIVLLEGTDGEVCEWVIRGAVDIGLTGECSNDLSSEMIAQDDFVVVVGRRHRLASRGPISIRELANHPFIMSGAGCEPAIRSFFADAACTPHVEFTVRDMTTLFEMVRQGLGITLVPSLSLPSDRSNLRIVKLKHARRRMLFAATKNERALVPAAGAFLGILREGQKEP